MFFLSYKILSLKKWLYQKGNVKTAYVYCNNIHLKVKFIYADVWCALYGLAYSYMVNFFFHCLENWLELSQNNKFMLIVRILDTHVECNSVSAYQSVFLHM